MNELLEKFRKELKELKERMAKEVANNPYISPDPFLESRIQSYEELIIKIEKEIAKTSLK